MSRGLLLVLDVLATYRLTRLVVADGITEPVRARLIGSRRGQWFEDLLTCRYCVGVWVGFGVMGWRWLAPGVWTPIAYALAIAALAPIIGGLEPDD